jgi:hypothetical protein
MGNRAQGQDSSISGGATNVAQDSLSSIVDGCGNITGPTSIGGGCNVAGTEAILGGDFNKASGGLAVV